MTIDFCYFMKVSRIYSPPTARVIKFSRIDRSSSSALPHGISRKHIAMSTTLRRFSRYRERERGGGERERYLRERETHTEDDGNRAPTLHSPFETGSDTGRFR